MLDAYVAAPIVLQFHFPNTPRQTAYIAQLELTGGSLPMLKTRGLSSSFTLKLHFLAVNARYLDNTDISYFCAPIVYIQCCEKVLVPFLFSYFLQRCQTYKASIKL